MAAKWSRTWFAGLQVRARMLAGVCALAGFSIIAAADVGAAFAQGPGTQPWGTYQRKGGFPGNGNGPGGWNGGPGWNSNQGWGNQRWGPPWGGPGWGNNSPNIQSSWFQRPYPYHLDYYRMKYGGSYAPYFGNLYGPSQVYAPSYWGNFNNGGFGYDYSVGGGPPNESGPANANAGPGMQGPGHWVWVPDDPQPDGAMEQSVPQTDNSAGSYGAGPALPK